MGFIQNVRYSFIGLGIGCMIGTSLGALIGVISPGFGMGLPQIFFQFNIGVSLLGLGIYGIQSHDFNQSITRG